MNSVNQIAHLNEILLGMERDLKLNELGRIEKNILYAASLLSEACSTFESEQLRNHALLADISRSSFFRSLKAVVDAGYLNHLPGTQRSVYTLGEK